MFSISSELRFSKTGCIKLHNSPFCVPCFMSSQILEEF